MAASGGGSGHLSSTRLVKMAGSGHCQKVQALKSREERETYKDKYIKKLDPGEKEVTSQARTTAQEILRDALKKKMYGEGVSIRYSEEMIQGTRYTFCAIPKSKLLWKLVRKLDRVKFRKDIGDEDAYAYVYPSDKTLTIYLCAAFWTAPSELSKDSQPGTLIHEVSHFLGLQDITYDHLQMEVERIPGSKKVRGQWRYIGEKSEVVDTRDPRFIYTSNANSLEYEYETILNHTAPYDEQGGRYPCCRETQRNSVCAERDTGHYSLHKTFS